MRNIAVAALMALSTMAFADEPLMLNDFGPDENNPGQFRAEGEHICWHQDFIGYKCQVAGVGYTDCHNAFFRLQKDNCCSRMYWKGKRLEGAISSSFKLTTCTRIH